MSSTRNTLLFQFVIAAILGLSLAAPVSAAPLRTYEYALIPQQSQLRYAIMESGSWREVYAGVEGSFQFQIDESGTIATQSFDLTITGPLFDSLLEPVDSAPFAPGDSLANFLAEDFANTSGLEIALPRINGTAEQGIPTAYIGPNVAGDSSMVSLGKNYYQISRLDVNPTVFFFDAQAREDIGGSFSIMALDGPPPQGYPNGDCPTQNNAGGDTSLPICYGRNDMAWLVPNVRLIPEPSSVALLAFAGAALSCCRRRARGAASRG